MYIDFLKSPLDKSLSIPCISFLLLLVSIVNCAAATYTDIKIEPEHVGVFYTNETQQFTALGLKSNGDWVDITAEVDWYVEENPLTDQTLTPGQVATIDEGGLATAVSDWGRINITACYPKGCGVKKADLPGWIPALNLLLYEKLAEKYTYMPWVNILLLRGDRDRKR